MTIEERWGFYESGELRQMIAIELLDWAGYWVTAGVDIIQDELTKRQTRQAVHMVLEDLSYCVKVVVGLVVSDSGFKNASADAVNDTLVRGIVTNIMSFKLSWLTAVESVE